MLLLPLLNWVNSVELLYFLKSFYGVPFIVDTLFPFLTPCVEFIASDDSPVSVDISDVMSLYCVDGFYLDVLLLLFFASCPHWSQLLPFN
jgi:hypothetical protein